jgi:hypothetical protein
LGRVEWGRFTTVRSGSRPAPRFRERYMQGIYAKYIAHTRATRASTYASVTPVPSRAPGRARAGVIPGRRRRPRSTRPASGGARRNSRAGPFARWPDAGSRAPLGARQGARPPLRGRVAGGSTGFRICTRRARACRTQEVRQEAVMLQMRAWREVLRATPRRVRPDMRLFCACVEWRVHIWNVVCMIRISCAYFAKHARRVSHMHLVD